MVAGVVQSWRWRWLEVEVRLERSWCCLGMGLREEGGYEWWGGGGGRVTVSLLYHQNHHEIFMDKSIGIEYLCVIQVVGMSRI